jgi:hypothetical protein
VPPQASYQFERETLGRVGEKYWGLISDRLDVLNERGWTYFRDSIGTGALVPVGAPLYWGDGYWAVAVGGQQGKFADLKGVDVLSAELWDAGWWVHRIQLAGPTDQLTERQREAVEGILGRRILMPRPKVYVESPAPHHIDWDGTWFLAGPCDELVVRVTAPSELAVREATRGISGTSFVQERMKIVRPPAGRFDILASGDVALTVEISEAAFLRATGIEVAFNNMVVDLLSLQTMLDESPNLPTTTLFKFRVPRGDIQDQITIDQRKAAFVEGELCAAILAERGCVIDAGPFGWVDTRRAAVNPHIEIIDELLDLRPLADWLAAVPLAATNGLHERLHGVRWAKCPQWIRILEARAWPKQVAPQVRLLLHELKCRGLA